MPLPETLLPTEHYAEHFLGNLREAEEHGKIVVGDATTAQFPLPQDALDALKEMMQ